MIGTDPDGLAEVQDQAGARLEMAEVLGAVVLLRRPAGRIAVQDVCRLVGVLVAGVCRIQCVEAMRGRRGDDRGTGRRAVTPALDDLPRAVPADDLSSRCRAAALAPRRATRTRRPTASRPARRCAGGPAGRPAAPAARRAAAHAGLGEPVSVLSDAAAVAVRQRAGPEAAGSPRLARPPVRPGLESADCSSRPGSASARPAMLVEDRRHSGPYLPRPPWLSVRLRRRRQPGISPALATSRSARRTAAARVRGCRPAPGHR